MKHPENNCCKKSAKLSVIYLYLLLTLPLHAPALPGPRGQGSGGSRWITQSFLSCLYSTLQAPNSSVLVLSLPTGSVWGWGGVG